MAWRIDQQVVRGEIDSRLRDKVTGRIWFVGRDTPLVFSLDGNPWRDLAGYVLTLTNPLPKPGGHDKLALVQTGLVGDITASRKVKVPNCSVEDLMKHRVVGQPFPWRWGNALYLEWFSHQNGRVVIESVDYRLSISSSSSWEMSEEEEIKQRSANLQALANYMRQFGEAANDSDAVD